MDGWFGWITGLGRTRIRVRMFFLFSFHFIFFVLWVRSMEKFQEEY